MCMIKGLDSRSITKNPKFFLILIQQMRPRERSYKQWVELYVGTTIDIWAYQPLLEGQNTIRSVGLKKGYGKRSQIEKTPSSLKQGEKS